MWGAVRTTNFGSEHDTASRGWHAVPGYEAALAGWLAGCRARAGTVDVEAATLDEHQHRARAGREGEREEHKLASEGEKMTWERGTWVVGLVHPGGWKRN